MPYPAEPNMEGIYTLHRASRLHATLVAWATAINAIFYATAPLAKVRPTAPGDFAEMECKQAPYAVLIPVHGVIEAVVRGEEINPMVIKVALTPPPSPRHFKTEGFSHPINALQMALFGNFVEPYIEWMDATYGADVNKHPNLFRFVRTIRNACAHRGTITIRNPHSRPATWRNLSYSAADTGRLAISSDLGVGDLMLLLLEFSDELDRKNAPNP